jgi:dTDP-4-amino-4,6-dideoxygalactose transaminase
MIPFKQTYYDEHDAALVRAALLDGVDLRPRARKMLESRFPGRRAFLTTSGSTAFELLFAGLALEPGSEVIMPSFTFPSCASAALRAGLHPVFADIDTQTLTLNLNDIERITTERTRSIALMHYGGASPDMAALLRQNAGCFIVEDAALSIGASHLGRPLGGIGDAGILSFHETKNVSADEGGALLVSESHTALIERLQMIYDNGTNRAAFLRGEASSYTWQVPGMNVSMPNLCAALLCAQLEKEAEITRLHRQVCGYYREALADDARRCGFALPHIPPENTDNGHVFYLLFAEEAQRERVRRHLLERGIDARFHYMPLHASAMGAKLGYQPKDLPVTQRVSAGLLRLPVYAELTEGQCAAVTAAVREAL